MYEKFINPSIQKVEDRIVADKSAYRQRLIDTPWKKADGSRTPLPSIERINVLADYRESRVRPTMERGINRSLIAYIEVPVALLQTPVPLTAQGGTITENDVDRQKIVSEYILWYRVSNNGAKAVCRIAAKGLPVIDAEHLSIWEAEMLPKGLSVNTWMTEAEALTLLASAEYTTPEI